MRELNHIDDIEVQARTILHFTRDVLDGLFRAIEARGGLIDPGIDQEIAAKKEEIAEARSRLNRDTAEEKRLLVELKASEKKFAASVESLSALRRPADRYRLAQAALRQLSPYEEEHRQEYEAIVDAYRPDYERWRAARSEVNALREEIERRRAAHTRQVAHNDRYRAKEGRMHYSNWISVHLGAELKTLLKRQTAIGGACAPNLSEHHQRLLAGLEERHNVDAFCGSIYNMMDKTLQGAMRDAGYELNEEAKQFLVDYMARGTDFCHWQKFNPFVVLADNQKTYTVVDGKKVFDCAKIEAADICKILFNYSLYMWRMDLLNGLKEFRYVREHGVSTETVQKDGERGCLFDTLADSRQVRGQMYDDDAASIWEEVRQKMLASVEEIAFFAAQSLQTTLPRRTFLRMLDINDARDYLVEPLRQMITTFGDAFRNDQTTDIPHILLLTKYLFGGAASSEENRILAATLYNDLKYYIYTYVQDLVERKNDAGLYDHIYDIWERRIEEAQLAMRYPRSTRFYTPSGRVRAAETELNDEDFAEQPADIKKSSVEDRLNFLLENKRPQDGNGRWNMGYYQE